MTGAEVRKRNWIVGVTLLIVATVVAVVVAMPESVPGPPVIEYGEDACDRCRMVISDERFASAYRTEDGKEMRFDDLGEMALSLKKEVDEPVTEIWVKDFQTLEWIEADSATYVYAPSFHSPMGFNVAALATREQAEQIAKEWEGRIVSWSDLPIEGATPGMGGMDMGGDMDMEDQHDHDM